VFVNIRIDIIMIHNVSIM